jgi:hypothetical protein
MPPTAEGAAPPVVLDLTGVSDRQGFMDRAAADLELPGWFGRNWDALADCLADLSWWPPVRGARRLHVRGWGQFAAALPREWRIVRDVLRDAEVFWRHSGTALEVTVEDDPARDLARTFGRNHERARGLSAESTKTVPGASAGARHQGSWDEEPQSQATAGPD